jgi:hypothetical protein
MKKINRFRFPNLSNEEFTRVVPHIVAIAKKYSVVLQKLEKRFVALQSFLPELDKIEAQTRKWREAKTLNEYEHSRSAYVHTLIRTEHTHSRVSIPGFEERRILVFRKRRCPMDTIDSGIERIGQLL